MIALTWLLVGIGIGVVVGLSMYGLWDCWRAAKLAAKALRESALGRSDRTGAESRGKGPVVPGHESRDSCPAPDLISVRAIPLADALRGPATIASADSGKFVYGPDRTP